MPHFSCSVFSRCIKFSHNVEAKLPNPLCLIRNNRTNFDELRYIVCVCRQNLFLACAVPGYAVSCFVVPKMRKLSWVVPADAGFLWNETAKLVGTMKETPSSCPWTLRFSQHLRSKFVILCPEDGGERQLRTVRISQLSNTAPQSVAQNLQLCTPVIPVAPVERPVHSTTDCSCVPTDMHMHHQHCESTLVALIVKKCAFWPQSVFVCSVWLQWPALTRTVFSVR